MQIFINNKLAAIKKNSSFEYVSENRLFTGSDAYTLNITFPLKDCPQNLEIFNHINRADFDFEKEIFQCEIRDKDFIKTGSVIITEINNIEVKCQFLEGRSETNYDKTFADIYINELKLGSGPENFPENISPADAVSPEKMEFKCVALPWVNNNSDSGLPHNFLQPFTSSSGAKTYAWDKDTDSLTWQPFLTYILDKICEVLGYTPDIDSLKNDVRTKYLLICNTLPQSWNKSDFANALPHWTVDEFLSKIELLVGGEFDIDHRNKKISFSFSKSTIENKKEICIDQVVDDHSAEIDHDGTDCEYIGNKNLAYSSDSSLAWKFYSCDWLLKSNILTVSYQTLEELLDSFRTMGLHMPDLTNYAGYTLNSLLYAFDVDTYFVFRIVDKVPVIVNQISSYNRYVPVLQPVNIFGNKIIAGNEDAQSEELDIVPVAVDYTDIDHGFAIFLDPGDLDENSPGFSNYVTDDATGAQRMIMNGSEESKNEEFYDKIYIGWYPGDKRPEAKMPYPVIDYIEPKIDWSGYHQWDCLPMRLNGKKTIHDYVQNINPKIKKTFRFLSNSIPDVRSVFIIRGKRYICEKITATFTEKGMSQLIKGVFYQIID